MKTIKPVEWIQESDDGLLPGHVRMIDQTRLPTELVYLETTDLDEIWDAIKVLKVRGAPAIGVAAAMGVAAVVQKCDAVTTREALDCARTTADHLATSRPTAVNLFWALDRMRSTAENNVHLGVAEFKECLAFEAVAIRNEDAAMCRAIGEHGATLLKDGDTVLTHCNAGALATSELGTALSPIYVATEQGKTISVISDETRPLLQGSRLTAWELSECGIDVTVICDNMTAQVMKEGRVDVVMVGSDRIAANGDTANKIGTYGVALLAKAHNIPFYVLAPSSTFDMDTATGDGIPIEQRGREEVVCGFGRQTAPDAAKVYSPAFDVTPVELISGFINENGIAGSPSAIL